MSSTPAPPAFDDPEKGTAWTAVVGLVLLWGAFIAVAYFSTLLSLWFLATLDAGAGGLGIGRSAFMRLANTGGVDYDNADKPFGHVCGGRRHGGWHNR